MRAAILLAAGRSTRFGRGDKLFAPLHGEPLLLRTIRIARAAPAGRLLVVTRHPARVWALVRRSGLRGIGVVRLRARAAPLSASLAAGIAALRPIERDGFLFLGDMPFVAVGMAARLARAGGRARIVRPRDRGVPGHPVFVRNVRAMRVGRGDSGFGGGAAGVRWVAGGRGCVTDVDARGDLTRARRGMRRG